MKVLESAKDHLGNIVATVENKDGGKWASNEGENDIRSTRSWCG